MASQTTTPTTTTTPMMMIVRPLGAPLPRPITPPGIPPPASAHRLPSQLSFGVVCSSNINRSMEAHLVLMNAGLQCASYGTGTQVRLPGRTAMEPRVFKFGTPYHEMYTQLTSNTTDAQYFHKNGVLQLCQRGAAVKLSPTRWQDCTTVHEHHVVICFEERIYDAVMEDLQTREPTADFQEIHVICLDTKDNPTEAAVSGQVCCDLCWRLEQCGKNHNLSTEAANVVDQFQQERAAVTPIKVLYQLCYL
jgi:RNA polymerase II subunit A C-terminal domain phosphatase SSU72